jgi:hypothetical protein
MGIFRSSNAVPLMSHKGHSRRFDSGLDRDLPNRFTPNGPSEDRLSEYFVNPSAGNAFGLVAFTIIVLGGMGSVPASLIGGLVIGVVESLTSLLLRESRSRRLAFSFFSSSCCWCGRAGCLERGHEGLAPVFMPQSLRPQSPLIHNLT